MTRLPSHASISGLSGDRFSATYRIAGDSARAREVGEHIAIEQTVEFPADLLPSNDIPDHIVGRVTDTVTAGPSAHDVTITYAVEIAAPDLIQLLNVAFGNVSLLPGVRLVGLAMPPTMTQQFRGPRFGVSGVRELVGAAHRPLLSSALKPLGLGSADLAAVAGALARGGVDMIKDDQGLADQVFCRFRDRVRSVAEAIAEANATTGTRAAYFANVTTRADRVLDRAHEAKDLGAKGLLICPSLVGLDAMRALADDDSLSLPIMSHPSFIGSHVAGPLSGIGHGLVFGTLQRLAGADISVFPSFGGRFSFTRAECREIAVACDAPLDSLRPALPAPGGGLTIESMADARATYGPHAAYLVGGGLHRAGPDLEANARAFRRIIETEAAFLDRAIPSPNGTAYERDATVAGH